MVDFADVAADAQADNLSATLSKRYCFEGESEHECQNCGFDIPEQRRKLGNVKLCIDCQTEVEKRLQHYRG